MFVDPVNNLKMLDLLDNMIVVDLGAGTGFYTIAASKMVPNGKVYAVEIDKDFLATIRNKVNDSDFSNVLCFWGDIEKIGGTMLADNIVDRVILSNVVSQVEDKDTLVEEVKRILKGNGKLLLVDWSENSFLMSNASKHKHMFLSEEKIIKIFEKKGFKKEKDVEVGDNHYGIIFSITKE